MAGADEGGAWMLPRRCAEQRSRNRLFGVKLKEGNILINLRHIEKYYGNFHVIEDLNLEIQKGEIYGLIGKNGAGKTTIFKIILGLSGFSGGSLSIAGSKGKVELLANRKRIGFFIGKNFFDYLGARENLKYYSTMKGIKDFGEIERVLKLVDLHEVKEQFIAFSMGMKQRLGVAAALLGNPEILILDEPTNGLDPQGIADIRNLIKQINSEYGTTIIVSSHILGELEHTATRFGIVHAGKLLCEVKLEDLRTESDIVQIKVSDVDKARVVLKKNGIVVIDEKTPTKNLENFYFELMEGKNE